jgi:hypothetical protein
LKFAVARVRCNPNEEMMKKGAVAREKSCWRNAQTDSAVRSQ